MFRITKVYVSCYVNNPPVSFFREAFIKAAVTGFHVEDGDMKTLSTDNGKAGIGISQNQNRIRSHFHHKLIRFSYDIANSFTQVLTHRIQVVVRFTKTEVFKKHLIQGVIIILTGMYKYLVKVLVTTLNGGRQADNLRTGAYDSH